MALRGVIEVEVVVAVCRWTSISIVSCTTAVAGFWVSVSRQLVAAVWARCRALWRTVSISASSEVDELSLLKIESLEASEFL